MQDCGHVHLGVLPADLLPHHLLDDYWYVGYFTMGQGIFWYYGMFSVPLIAVFIDVLGYCFYLFFKPTPEMVFREMEHQVCT